MKKPTLRLYWGENHAPKPVAVTNLLSKVFLEASEIVNVYPGDVQSQAKKALAIVYKVKPEQVIIGNGIEGLLITIFSTFINPGDEVITLSPTFGGYQHLAEEKGGQIVPITVKLSQTISAEDILNKVTNKTIMICLASPNTMTGFYHLDISELEKIISSFPDLVVIDECYFGIGNLTCLPLIQKYNNLIVLRSASKSWGLAGLRIGFAASSEDIIKRLDQRSLALAPDPLPTVSYQALSQILPFAKSLERSFVQFKADFTTELTQFKEIEVYPSSTTFIPIELPGTLLVGEFIKRMAQSGFLLKDTSSLGYLLLGIPPKKYWSSFFTSFKASLHP